MVNGRVTFTIPANATGVINIRCYPFEGPGSNTVQFSVVSSVVVTQPPPPTQPPQLPPPTQPPQLPPPTQPLVDGDADGDGVRDSMDACPFVSGRGDQFGGVTGTNGCPVDSDADGVNDGLDRCPFESGLAESGGCPAPIILPTLPIDGVCNVATINQDSVNLRGGPSTGDDVVGTLTFQQIAVAVALSEDGEWFQLDDGAWAASWVVRDDGECDNLGADIPDLPTEEPPPLPPPSPAAAAPVGGLPDGWQDAFAACPTLLDGVSGLPVHMILLLAFGPDACGNAEILLTDMLFADPFVALDAPAFEGMLEQCALQAAALADFFDTLATVDRPLAEVLQNSVTVAERCRWGQAILDRTMLPIPSAVASYSASSYFASSYFASSYFASSYFASSYSAPSYSAPSFSAPGVIPTNFQVNPPDWAVVAAVQCFGQQAQDYAFSVAGTLVSLDFSQARLDAYGGDMCSAVDLVAWLSDLNTRQLPAGDQALYNQLVGVCGLDPYYPPDETSLGALHLISTARQHLVDVETVRADSTLCDDPENAILLVAPLLNVAGLDPSIPPSLRDCPNLVPQLQDLQLDIYELFKIFHGAGERERSGSNCATLEAYLDPDLSVYAAPVPSCSIITSTAQVRELAGFELPDGTIIDNNTPWHQRIAALDRADVCAPLDLPAYDVTTDLPGVACYNFVADVINSEDNQDSARAQLLMRYTDGRPPTVETGVFSQPLPGVGTHTLAFTALVHDPEQSPLAELDHELALPSGVQLSGEPWLYEVPLDQCRGMASPVCTAMPPQLVSLPDNAIVRGDVPLRFEADLCAGETSVWVQPAEQLAESYPHYEYFRAPFTQQVIETIAPADNLEDCTLYEWYALNFQVDETPSGPDRLAAQESAEKRTFFTNFDNTCTNVPACDVTAPTLVGPVENAVVHDGPPELRWDDNSGCAATEYETQVAYDQNFTNMIASNNVNGLSAVPWLTPDQSDEVCARHYWRVRGIRGGEVGPWPATGSYILNATEDCLPGAAASGLAAPTLVSPFDDQIVFSTLPSLQWEYTGSAMPDYFAINVYTDAELTRAVRSAFVGVSSRWWMPTQPLEACSFYYWTVTPVTGLNLSAVGGPVSETGTFSIECTAQTEPSVPEIVTQPWPPPAPSNPVANRSNGDRASRDRTASASTTQSVRTGTLFWPGAERYGTVQTPLVAEREREGTLQLPLVAEREREGVLVDPERTGRLVLGRGLLALLMGSSSPADIFSLVDDDLTSLTASPTIDDRYPTLSPQGDLLAYLSIPESGRTVLNMMSLSRRVTAPIWGDTDTLRLVNAAPAWSPDGETLLLTMTDAVNSVGVYALDMRVAPNFDAPTLYVSLSTSAR